MGVKKNISKVEELIYLRKKQKHSLIIPYTLYIYVHCIDRLPRTNINTHLIATHGPPTQTRYQTRQLTNPQRGQKQIPNTKEQTNP
ncbi:hypothetical protein PEX1_011180 [Penicillium expansum]|uniref:Uncharacterized protein n=1 Tax=Penicillium expansum TaxID=27334 RepID=A0A0A2I5L2_PENEN|nr:hypothetical protein PEX2_038980 [Penicillium expansum]KGO38402.1 hypothetical protein PEXP_109450 [Penicillium expansum]KGO54194.1 hypothetical protein PEX2_038980 [Penicillium expansum]KGO70613.1 hypothetical protein PEX1_011180 [Penicillium expansum]